MASVRLVTVNDPWTYERTTFIVCTRVNHIKIIALPAACSTCIWADVGAWRSTDGPLDGSLNPFEHRFNQAIFRRTYTGPYGC